MKSIFRHFSQFFVKFKKMPYTGCMYSFYLLLFARSKAAGSAFLQGCPAQLNQSETGSCLWFPADRLIISF
jgi:hypothetical protein